MAYKEIAKPNCTVYVPTFQDQYTTDISVLVLFPGIPVNGKTGKSYFPPLIKGAVPTWFNKYVMVIPNEHTTKWDSVKKEYTEAMASVPQGTGKDPKYVLTEKTVSIGVFSGSGNGNVSIQTKLVSINPAHLIIMDPSASGPLTQNVKTLTSKGTSCYMMYNPNNWNSYPALKNGFPSLAAAVDAGGNKSLKVSLGHMAIPAESLKKFATEVEKKLITPTQKKQDQPVVNEEKKTDEKAAEDANQPGKTQSTPSAKWNITIDGLGDSALGSASTPYQIQAKKDLPNFTIYVGNPETDWARFGEQVPVGGDDFENVGDDAEGLDEEFTEQGFAGDEEEIAYQLGSIFGDSEGSEDDSSGSSGSDPSTVETGSLPPQGSAGGSGDRRFQKSMLVNGTKVLNGELPKNLVKKALGFELETHAANKLLELNVKYKEKFGTNIPIGGANRSFEVQNAIFDWPFYERTKKGRKKGTNGGVAAAKPGTSQHGWGLAIDCSGLGDKGSPKFDWMDANAPKYGWVNPGWAKKGGAGHEPWHWEYVGKDAYKNDGAK